MNTIKLVIGDFSGDGHDKTETVTISCNKTDQELRDAFFKGCEQIGVKSGTAHPLWKAAMFENFARKFEDSVIPDILLDYFGLRPFVSLQYSKTYDANAYEAYTLEEFKERYKDHPTHDGVPYVAIWLAVAQVGDPELIVKVTADATPKVSIGGYGLFYM